MSAPTVLISSLGLMGGSLAAALTRVGWPVLLHHRRPEVALRGEELGYGKAVSDLAQSLAHADLVVVCTPVSAIAPTIRAMAALHARPVFTDVGSVKGAICADLDDLARSGRFVGSHPMAGSHLQGIDHAQANLYHDCMTILTPLAETPAAPVTLVEKMWRAVGSRLCRFSPADHDRAVAEASHLPHVLAAAAASQLGATAAPLAATGFRDTTRVAGGSIDMWSDILLHNRQAVGSGLVAMREHLAQLARALAAGDETAVRAWLEAGREGRQRFEHHAVMDVPILGEEA
ncbi:MAG: prephenate dehydrogenase/arogenate dehydrogenase family protein [Planctomycetes bacterium]|nr:prephenate dehydrogenase/arogenate dehydrogenase family protein [Planctomycetota bacterium]